MTNKRFKFMHKNRIVTFGPYTTVVEAKAAFQRNYGYWPDKVESTEDWPSK